MKLDVTKALRNPGQHYPLEVEQTIAPQDVGGDEVTFDPATLKGEYVTGEDGSVTVEGLFHTVAHAQCANCLAPASAEITAEFRETFYHGGDPEDDESFAYEGSKLDFEKLAMFCAMLNLPMRFLCKEDCQGFSEYAGEDVNMRSCHKELPGQHPFAALQQLLAEKSDQDSHSVSAGCPKKDEEV